MKSPSFSATKATAIEWFAEQTASEANNPAHDVGHFRERERSEFIGFGPLDSWQYSLRCMRGAIEPDALSGCQASERFDKLRMEYHGCAGLNACDDFFSSRQRFGTAEKHFGNAIGPMNHMAGNRYRIAVVVGSAAVIPGEVW
jgi:hypothetical protein